MSNKEMIIKVLQQDYATAKRRLKINKGFAIFLPITSALIDAFILPTDST